MQNECEQQVNFQIKLNAALTNLIKSNWLSANTRNTEVASLRDAFVVLLFNHRTALCLYGVIEVKPLRGFFGAMRIINKSKTPFKEAAALKADFETCIFEKYEHCLRYKSHAVYYNQLAAGRSRWEKKKCPNVGFLFVFLQSCLKL